MLCVWHEREATPLTITLSVSLFCVLLFVLLHHSFLSSFLLSSSPLPPSSSSFLLPPSSFLLPLGMILLLFGALATVFSIQLLIRARNQSQLFSYEDLTVTLFGKAMGIIVELNIIVFCFGTSVAYVVAVGDILDPFLHAYHAPWWLNR